MLPGIVKNELLDYERAARRGAAKANLFLDLCIPVNGGRSNNKNLFRQEILQEEKLIVNK